MNREIPAYDLREDEIKKNGFPITHVRNDDREGDSLILPCFAGGTDPSPGLWLSLVEYLKMTNLENPGNECGNAKEEKKAAR